MEKIATIELEFGVAEIYPRFLVAFMNEGVLVTPKMNQEFVKLVSQYYPSSSFAYITHRVNSYSVDPSVYIETSKIPNLIAIAVVSNNPLNIGNAKVEKLFSKKPFKTFKKMDAAIKWAEGLFND